MCSFREIEEHVCSFRESFVFSIDSNCVILNEVSDLPLGKYLVFKLSDLGSFEVAECSFLVSAEYLVFELVLEPLFVESGLAL